MPVDDYLALHDDRIALYSLAFRRGAAVRKHFHTLAEILKYGFGNDWSGVTAEPQCRAWIYGSAITSLLDLLNVN